MHRKNFFLFFFRLSDARFILLSSLKSQTRERRVIRSKKNKRKKNDENITNRKEDRNSYISLLSLFERAEKLISNVRAGVYIHRKSARVADDLSSRQCYQYAWINSFVGMTDGLIIIYQVRSCNCYRSI